MRGDIQLGKKYANTIRFAKWTYTAFAALYACSVLGFYIGIVSSFVGPFSLALPLALVLMVLGIYLWSAKLPAALRTAFLIAMIIVGGMAIAGFFFTASMTTIPFFDLLTLAMCQRGWAAAGNEHYHFYVESLNR